MQVAEKLRAAIESTTLTRTQHPTTASLGLAIYPDMTTDADTLLRLADRALYTAKAQGRNRAQLAPEANGANAPHVVSRQS